jgi:hypothetical protein
MEKIRRSWRHGQSPDNVGAMQIREKFGLLFFFGGTGA